MRIEDVHMSMVDSLNWLECKKREQVFDAFFV